ncbi:hypothetical protein FHT87_005129 [Rhizobium sp. BK316]|uniref:hypothetical protein n=1 Tax=Rhizobium sp. BK316 TaxID=2587053 RepID=UPI001621AC3D|nr:hypothetical protein [Rhizobium sp. BK316]MBB3411176.1 hypothetical protein [Rhizobium sp. BK316]
MTDTIGRLREARRTSEVLDLLEEAIDKIEGLEADLDSAVEVAYKRGATEWVRLNYPAKYAKLKERNND